MSIDISWRAKHPGLIPLAILRAALEEANAKLAPETRLRLVGGEDEAADPVDEAEIVEPGAVFLVRAEGLGHITLFQPEDERGSFHMSISSSTEGRGRSFEKLGDAADTLAGGLGMVVEHDPTVKEALEKLTGQRGPRVDVVSVRVVIGLGSGESREVAIEGSLATLEASKLDLLETMTLRAASHALALSSRADGRTTLDDLVTWAGEAGYRLESRDGDMAHLEQPDDGEEAQDLPLISISVSEREVDLTSYPELDLDFEHALEHNYVELRGATKLGLDDEGDWCFTAVLRRDGLDRAFFLETLAEFAEDLQDLIDGHGGGEDAAADEDDEDEDEDEDQPGEPKEEAAAEVAAPPPAPAKTKMLERFTKGARQLVADAQRSADTQRHAEMTLLHLLARCLDEPSIAAAFSEAGADVDAARKKLAPAVALLPKSDEPSYVSAPALALIERTEADAEEREVSLLDFVVALVTTAVPTSIQQADAGLASQEVRSFRRIVEAGRLERLRNVGKA